MAEVQRGLALPDQHKFDERYQQLEAEVVFDDDLRQFITDGETPRANQDQLALIEEDDAEILAFKAERDHNNLITVTATIVSEAGATPSGPNQERLYRLAKRASDLATVLREIREAIQADFPDLDEPTLTPIASALAAARPTPADAAGFGRTAADAGANFTGAIPNPTPDTPTGTTGHTDVPPTGDHPPGGDTTAATDHANDAGADDAHGDADHAEGGHEAGDDGEHPHDHAEHPAQPVSPMRKRLRQFLPRIMSLIEDHSPAGKNPNYTGHNVYDVRRKTDEELANDHGDDHGNH